jgi:hypothetical protein
MLEAWHSAPAELSVHATNRVIGSRHEPCYRFTPRIVLSVHVFGDIFRPRASCGLEFGFRRQIKSLITQMPSARDKMANRAGLEPATFTFEA